LVYEGLLKQSRAAPVNWQTDYVNHKAGAARGLAGFRYSSSTLTGTGYRIEAGEA
jgi:hypothetical protein